MDGFSRFVGIAGVYGKVITSSSLAFIPQNMSLIVEDGMMQSGVIGWILNLIFTILTNPDSRGQ